MELSSAKPVSNWNTVLWLPSRKCRYQESEWQHSSPKPAQPRGYCDGNRLSITICADKTLFHMKKSKFIWNFGHKLQDRCLSETSRNINKTHQSMIFILQRPAAALQKIYLKGISIFIAFFNPPGDVCLKNRRHFFPRCSIVPAAYYFWGIREPLLHFLLSYLGICANRIVCWAIILPEHKTASCPDNTECRNVAKPINQHFSITAVPSRAAEGNNQSLDFRRSLFIMQSPYTFHPASSSVEEEGHQQSLWNHCCWKLSPLVPLPPHNPLFEALPAIATRTNWNSWWWRSKDLANAPIKKQGKNVYLKYFWLKCSS